MRWCSYGRRMRGQIATIWSGFQNHMRFGDQARVFRLIPGMQNAEFLRFGQMHRNTYINSPALLRPTMQLKDDGRIFFAGQISGVEGYAESIATGLIAGRNAAAVAAGENRGDLAARDCTRKSDDLHYGGRREKFSAREHHFRSFAFAGR